MPEITALKNTAQTKRLRACLIDDDALQAATLKRMLKKFPTGDNLIVFNDGDYVLKYLKKNNNTNKIPDVIFLDIDMPIVDGWEFLEGLGKIKDSFPKKVDVYMLSSSVNPADKAKALSSKLVKDYISKPMTINHFYSIFN